MGGMQALEWAVSYPDAVRRRSPSRPRRAQRRSRSRFTKWPAAIMGDPDWRGGNTMAEHRRLAA